MRKNKINLKFRDKIQKNYINNSTYKKNKRYVDLALISILKNLDNHKNIFHSFSKKFKFNFSKSDLNKFKKYKTIVIIGMGGSILGSEAIYNFLKHKIKKTFLFIDNLDQEKIENINKKINLNDTLFIVISKSGNTTETLINLSLLKKYKNINKNFIIITENKNNALNNFAKRFKILQIHHKNYIGGRYSVLSEVGMLPAIIMGLNINKLRKNLINNFKSNLKNVLSKNVAKISQIYSKNSFNSIVLLSYCSELNEFLYWYQQLIAESLGKKQKGLIPIVSLAPKDNHSLLQLYLDGPKDKIFYIFSGTPNKRLKIKKNYFGNFFNFVKNKDIKTILDSQKKAFTKVLNDKKIPFREFNFNKLNEETIGELFSYFIIETVLIGKLIGVNPYNQPAVEEIKVLTKKYLT